MAVPIPKTGYNKKPVKNDQVTTFFVYLSFYYRMEPKKYPVFYSDGIGRSIMTVPIPKIGYNKKWVKNDQVTTLLCNYHFYNQKKYLCEESPEIMQIYRKKNQETLEKILQKYYTTSQGQGKKEKVKKYVQI